ncbi:MAG: glycosyltransferase family 2 protein [Mariniphaga sp.]
MLNSLVSIGVPCYNRPIGLDRLLSQLSRQSFSDIEIIVSDNYSPDKSVISIARKHALTDPRIKVFQQSKNIGAVGNHDFVKKRAQGKYFLWVHDDDELPENYIEICLKHLEAVPEATLVGPSCDRYLDGEFWLTPDNWSSEGQKTYERLSTLMPDGFNCHWRFEQYLSGLFLLEAAPNHVSKDFKSQFHHFFVLSEAGSIIHAPELKLIKHTDQENIRKYTTGEIYRRHWILKFFGWDTVESVQQCMPITLQMLRTIIGSKRLTIKEKYKLIAQCVHLFVRYSVKDETNRFRRKHNFKRIKRIPSWIGGKIKNSLTKSISILTPYI